MTLDADEPIGLVEYDDGSMHGVGQLAYHAWGALLAPLDERLPWIPMRRSSIEDVRTMADEGLVEVVLAAGEDGTAPGVVRLLGLGAAARTRGDRLAGLRAAAQDDAARIIDALVPDAPYAARQEAARTLIDGHPARRADLPLSWSSIQTGVLVDPTFAAAYEMLRTKAGPLADEHAIAIAPIEPGGDKGRSWFLVPLPGNLVALELVSEGAHATYAFRVQPRMYHSSEATDPRALRDTVRVISDALVDSRFLREPMALPDEALRLPRNLRYRLALAALPSLAAARARFVARIIHRDDASWAAALDDLIAWHAQARDDAATWPGRATQEALIDDADATDDHDLEASASDEPTATPGAT
jgi:hypothetical protein